MNEIELIQAERDSFPVPELRTMLGIGKTDSYHILKSQNLQTVIIHGRIRILKDSFWDWYRHQTRYRLTDGPEPGSALKEFSYSVPELAQLLSVSEGTVYAIIHKNVFDTVTVDHQMRVCKESFERWYRAQDKYRLPEDRAADSEILADSYSMPDIGRMLGLHRNLVYHILKAPGFEFVMAAGQKRVTAASFDRWYAAQSRYRKKPQEVCEAENSGTPEPVLPAHVQAQAAPEPPPDDAPMQSKDVYTIGNLMAALDISRRAAAQLIQTGEIIAVKAGKSYLIPASEFKRYTENR